MPRYTNRASTAKRIENMLRLTLFLSLLLTPFTSGAQQHTVALTFDDLPAAGTNDAAEARSFNSTILSALDRHKAPAVGFVIEERLRQLGGRQILKGWVRRGYDLGNHTFSHADFNALSVEQFEQEVIAGEAAVTDEMGHRPRYFRFPDNHTGDTQNKHDGMAAFLAARGYTLAVCTIDNEDYLFNKAYVKMVAKNDTASAALLRAAYLTYTATEIDYYASLHQKVFSREIPQVMLLHVNRLNADVIEQLLRIFEEKKYRFASLAAALSDSAYKTPDTLAVKGGMMWGYRWARELGVKVNGSLEPEAPEWVVKYGAEQ
jgi:peptidoglycan/xylan/chitin deacetylase (PgdA/CDA1 family)